MIKGTHAADMRESLVSQGAEPVGGTPKEFAAFIKKETVKYARVIKEAGVKGD
jgi:tripartite-type tricarboxylate transporter receptor subunit TctC